MSIIKEDFGKECGAVMVQQKMMQKTGTCNCCLFKKITMKYVNGCLCRLLTFIAIWVL